MAQKIMLKRLAFERLRSSVFRSKSNKTTEIVAHARAALQEV